MTSQHTTDTTDTTDTGDDAAAADRGPDTRADTGSATHDERSRLASSQETSRYAEMLREYAEHFVQRDWAYTRNLGRLRALSYRPSTSWMSRARTRAQLAVQALTPGRDPLAILDGLPVRDRLLVALAHLTRRERHLPDGVLDGGAIITAWEETGEYLQLVQPSVGSLIAAWMAAEPENPHAQRVAAEIRRISDDYRRRHTSAASAPEHPAPGESVAD